jgi:thiol-disulfide isomerase/thioredoxin
MAESTTSPSERRGKPSPILIIFLVFPVMGILAAAALALSNMNIEPEPTPLPVSLEDTSLIGKPAPNFELTGLDGERYRLSTYRGRVVFVNFWATWCEPCQRELPTFAQFSADEANNGAVILAVNLAETTEAIEDYFAEHGISGINVLLDENLDVQGAYGPSQFPTTYVLDPAGVVKYIHLGEMKTDDLAAYVAELGVMPPNS